MFNEKQLALYKKMNVSNFLEELTQLLSEYCDNPVLTMDYLHQVRSSCRKGNEHCITWNEMIEIGYLDSNRIEDFFHATMKSLIENQKPMRITYEDETMILTPVICNGLFMGLVAVLEISHSLNDEEIEYTQIVADILSLHCNSDIIGTVESEYKHHHILIDLLNDEIINSHKLYDRMKARKWKRADSYQVILSDFSSYQESYQNYLINNISNALNDCKVFVYKGYLFILVECDNKIISKVTNSLKGFNLKLGISDSFNDLFELKFYYYQAKKALIYNEYNQNKINQYDEVRFKDFIYECHKLNKLNTFYHSNVLDLIQYDQVNQTNLFETLSQYFDTDKNLIQTSKNMNVHKNTIIYRIQKMKEMYPKLFEDELHVRMTISLIKDIN